MATEFWSPTQVIFGPFVFSFLRWPKRVTTKHFTLKKIEPNFTLKNFEIEFTLRALGSNFTLKILGSNFTLKTWGSNFTLKNLGIEFHFKNFGIEQLDRGRGCTFLELFTRKELLGEGGVSV